jgi:ABC-2 type transport system permease protein
MNQTLAIAKRELTSLFFSPIAYVVLALFGFAATMIFMLVFAPGQPAELRTSFTWIVWLMVFLVPAISMRLVSEELRSGTIESLMTSPLNDTQVIVGKWLGAMGFLCVLLSPLLFHLLVLAMYSKPDFGPIITGFLGLLLVGGLYLAIGTFASAATQNQIIAFLVTVFITATLTIVLYNLAGARFVSPNVSRVLFYLNVDQQYAEFAKGVLDTKCIVYFVSGIALFLFFAVKLLESKRWR